MSEKMDGIRAYWNGTKLISRHGKEINIPEYFTQGLPSTPLDGELWMGRGTYEKMGTLLKQKDKSVGWDKVGYYIFDLPSSTAPYEERIKHLQQLALPPWVHVIANFKCTSMDHLKQYLEAVLEKGGEGVMAREPRYQYIAGRTFALLKVKVTARPLFVCLL